MDSRKVPASQRAKIERLIVARENERRMLAAVMTNNGAGAVSVRFGRKVA